jgi:hypothetical protein
MTFFRKHYSLQPKYWAKLAKKWYISAKNRNVCVTQPTENGYFRHFL